MQKACPPRERILLHMFILHLYYYLSIRVPIFKIDGAIKIFWVIKKTTPINQMIGILLDAIFPLLTGILHKDGLFSITSNDPLCHTVYYYIHSACNKVLGGHMLAYLNTCTTYEQ